MALRFRQLVAGMPVGLAAAQKKGVLNKTTWLQYNAIEEEPSVPATNLIGKTHNADWKFC